MRHHSWDIPVLAVPGSIPGIGPSWLVLAYKSNNNHRLANSAHGDKLQAWGKSGSTLEISPLGTQSRALGVNLVSQKW